MELGSYTSGGESLPYLVERQNLLFIGKRKTGKSQTLIRMALDDIYNNEKIIFLGNESAEELLTLIPNERQAETVYFNPLVQPLAFNVFSNVPKSHHKALANSLIDTIHSLLSYEGSTPVLDDYVRAGTLTLLPQDDTSLLSLYFLLTDSKYRRSVTNKTRDDFLLSFWQRFEELSPKDRRTDTSSTLNKLSVFVFDPLLRNCLDQPKNHISIENGITVVPLNNAELGEDSAAFLGALVIASILAQADLGIRTTIYIDDASRYGGRILEKLLKHPSITTVLSVQSLDQFQNYNDILKAVDVVALRTSLKDARILESDFNLNSNHYPLNLIKPFDAYKMGAEDFADIFQIEPNHYCPPIRPKNVKKRVEDRIIDRCASEYTQPIHKIESRLGRFF